MPRLATIAPFGFADFHPPTLLPLYHRLGCRSSQFYRNPEHPPDFAEARHIAQDAGVPFDSMHGLFGMQYDPSSPVESVRRAAIDTYRAEGELSLKLGGPKVVVHPAPPAVAQDAVTNGSRLRRDAPLRKSMEELAAIGADLGVIYLFENIPANYEHGSDPIQLAQWIRELSHPKLRMCIDTGHAHMTRGVEPALEQCADVASYLHVHDNDTTTDDHRIPGLGTIPWDRLAGRFAQFPADMPAMLELFYSEEQIKDAMRAGLGERLRRWLALVE